MITDALRRNFIQSQGTTLTGSSLTALLGGRPTGAGIPVNRENATTLSPVHRAVSVVAGDIAASRFLERNVNTLELRTTPLFRSPHPLVNSFQWREMIVMHILMHGNHYSLINSGKGRNRISNEVLTLFPLDPMRVKPMWVIGSRGNKMVPLERVYMTTALDDGMPVAIPEEDILHIPGAGYDGLQGYSVIHKMAESVGTSLAAELYAGKLYGSGSMMSGILTTENRLTEDQAMAMKARWQAKVGGMMNAGEVAVLDSGVSFDPMTINPNDAQFSQGRDFSVDEVARWMGVPTRLLMKSSGAASVKQQVEQDNIEFALHTLEPMAARITAAMDHKQITAPDWEPFIDLGRFYQGDSKTRSGARLLDRKGSIRTINELREEEGLPRLTDPRADDIFEPLTGGAGPEAGGADEGAMTDDQGDGNDAEPGTSSDRA